MSYPKLTPIIAKGATEPRYLEDRFADVVNVKDFGAKGDGVTDDSAAFSSLETTYAGRFVNLCGASYAVDSIPNGNVYFNGSFVINGTQKEVLNCRVLVEEGSLTGVGAKSPNLVLSGEKPVGFNSVQHDGIVSFGTGNLEAIDSAKRAGSLIAIGEGVMSEGHPSSFNIGLGVFALHNVNGVYSATGDRNTAIGSLSLYGLTTGRANVGLGRDTGQSIIDGSYNVCLGYQALSGYAVMGLSGKIEPQIELHGSNNIAIGKGAGSYLAGSSANNVAIGIDALKNKKSCSDNVIIGINACMNAGSGESVNGKTIVADTISGTYSQTGNTITITAADHSAVAGKLVLIKFTSGEIYDSYTRTDPQYLTVDTVVSSSVFTIVSPKSLTASGNCEVWMCETNTSVDSNNVVHEAVIIGSNAAKDTEKLEGSISIGAYAGGSCDKIRYSAVTGGLACQNASDISNSVVSGVAACRNSPSAINNSVAIGRNTAINKGLTDTVVIGCEAAGATNNRTIQYGVIIGRQAAYSVEASSSPVDSCTVIGRYAGRACTNLDNCTFVGMSAGNVLDGELEKCTAVGSSAMLSNSTATISKSTAIGYGSSVTGSNQVQLGTPTETTYAYGAVQDRSDARDKTDIRDTSLGLDFLLSLRPVDFKWDYRDDYIDAIEREVETVDEEGNLVVETETSFVQREKDGSRKRNRYHHGLIAQEVKAVLDEKGIDFGGYQDHKINGGKDVLTLGYEEFIGPLIKSIQELNTKIEQLTERINQLTNNS